MLAYEKALDWQDLFDVAVQQQLSTDDLHAAAYRVAGNPFLLVARRAKLIDYSNRGPFLEEEVPGSSNCTSGLRQRRERSSHCSRPRQFIL